MSRCKSWIAILALLIVATALAAVALPEKAEAANLRGKLRAAKTALRESRNRLKNAEAALAAALAGTTALGAEGASGEASPAPTPTASPDVTALQARVTQVRHAVRRWQRMVRRIARQVRLQRQLVDWERRAKWMPLIEIAAAKYQVKADGIYRMMMRESGGRRYAGSDSPYKGLFQFWTGTWSASWNPWRHDSIYDGSSQINAACYAVGKGWGAQFWTTTFASQY